MKKKNTLAIELIFFGAGFGLVALAAVSAPSFADSAAKPQGRRVASAPKYSFETSAQESVEGAEQSGTALTLYFGGGASYYSVLSHTAQEPDKSGPGFQGKLGLVLFTRQLALELGGGWLQSTVESGTVFMSSQTSVSSRSARVETRAGILELSPRLRFADYFEIGPSAGALFGTETAFGESASASRTTILGGAKFVADWFNDDLHVRLVAQAQTSLFLSERQVVFGSLGIELGLPLISGKTRVREVQVRQIEEHEAVEYVETQVEVPVVKEVEVVKEVVREVVLFTFDDQIVHFEFDRAELTPASRRFVSRLGGFLASQPGIWSGLKIEGHTDNRGSEDYNLKLSEARAATVRAALVASGVPAEKLQAQGLGLSAPLDRSPSDLSNARNRRVELSFSDVSDARALRDGINRVRLESTVPSTCSGGHCR